LKSLKQEFHTIISCIGRKASIYIYPCVISDLHALCPRHLNYITGIKEKRCRNLSNERIPGLFYNL